MARAATPQPPTLKRAPKADDSDFRIQANDKSYEIEKRVGEKWQTIASLAIEIASCKLKPIEAKEPPTTTEVTPKTDPDDPKPAAVVKKKGPVN